MHFCLIWLLFVGCWLIVLFWVWCLAFECRMGLSLGLYVCLFGGYCVEGCYPVCFLIKGCVFCELFVVVVVSHDWLLASCVFAWFGCCLLIAG